MAKQKTFCKQYMPGIWMKRGVINNKTIGFLASVPDMDSLIPKKFRKIEFLQTTRWDERHRVDKRWEYWIKPSFPVVEWYILDTISPRGKFDLFTGNDKLKKINGLENMDVSGITDFTGMFRRCRIRRVHGVEKWDMSHAENISSMFQGCPINDFTDVKDWDVSNVKSMRRTFAGTTIKNADAFAKWDVSGVRDFKDAFTYCDNLENVTGLASWDVSNARELGEMFASCHKLADVSGLSEWDTANVSNFYRMFYNCGKLSNHSLAAIGKWRMGAVLNGDGYVRYRRPYSHSDYVYGATEQMISGTLASREAGEKLGRSAKAFIKEPKRLADVRKQYGTKATFGMLSMSAVLQVTFKDADSQKMAIEAHKAGVPLADILA